MYVFFSSKENKSLWSVPQMHIFFPTEKKEQKTAPTPAWVTEIFKTINLPGTIIDFTEHEAAEALDSSHSLP